MASSNKKSPKKSGKKKKPIMISRPPGSEDDGPTGVVMDHKHCFNCGVSITPDKDVCSNKCQAEWDRMMKRKKMMTYIPYVGIGLVILFYMLVIYSQ
jgi:predicted nucleic acid-binding Zn ribbon protein